MHCLLCQEKIPRLRAWSGKSEFCCDEHAELYKKQTMDRLLSNDSQSNNAAPALPIFGGGAASVDHILLKGEPKKAKRAKQANEATDVDELWKLSERIGSHQDESPANLLLQDISSDSQGDVQTQSAEEALAALQSLAEEATPDSPAGGDLLEEFSSMESSLEGLAQFDSLPIDLAAEVGRGALDEAPELELEALEPPAANAETPKALKPVAQAADLDAIDAADLLLEGPLETQAEALEPPELPAESDAEQDEESLKPPDAASEEPLAAPDASDEQNFELPDLPEPADVDLAEDDEAVAARPAAVPVARRAYKAATGLRPATELQELSPSPNLPESGYEMKPWTDALAIAGPSRSSLLSPAKSLEMRKASLNGPASATFDLVQFQACGRIASVRVPISEPRGPAVSFESQDDALTPASVFAWPAPLYTALVAAEMRLNGTAEGIAVGESFFSVKQHAPSAELLSRVAHKSRILEPRFSAILSPSERDVFASASAEEEESGSEYTSAAGRSDREETEGGERVHVANLF